MPRSMRSAISSSNICPSALGDVSMINFRALDHETRTVALAGTFLQAWAGMEMALGSAIGTVLELKSLQQFVLSKNLPFTNKVHVFGALCSVSTLSDTDRASCKMLCTSMLKLYPFRNNIAHDAFCSSDSCDGIQFMAFRARGKVSFPDVEWDVEKCEAIFRSISGCTVTMYALAKRLRETKKPVNLLAAFSALAAASPMEETNLASFLNPPSPQPLTPQNSDMNPANPETETETLPSREE